MDPNIDPAQSESICDQSRGVVQSFDNLFNRGNISERRNSNSEFLYLHY